MAQYGTINPDAFRPDINPADRNNMAIAAGYTGWDDYNDQKNRPAQGNPSMTNGQVSSPGSGGFNLSSTGQSSLNIQDLYNKSINSPEILDLNKALTDIDSQIKAKKDALTAAETLINDNPFYSTATRSGKISKLNEQANKEINNLIEQRNAKANDLATKKADVQTSINIALKQYDVNNAEYQKNLGQLNLLLSSGALANASGSDLAGIATATGISTSLLQGMVTAAKQKNVQPHVVTSEDNAGNVSVSIIDLNTGNIIKTQSLGAVGKGKTGTAADAKDTAISSAAYMIELYRNTNKGNPSWEKGHTLRSNYSPADFYKQLIIDFPSASDYVKIAFPEGAPKDPTKADFSI